VHLISPLVSAAQGEAALCAKLHLSAPGVVKLIRKSSEMIAKTPTIRTVQKTALQRGLGPIRSRPSTLARWRLSHVMTVSANEIKGAGVFPIEVAIERASQGYSFINSIKTKGIDSVLGGGILENQCER
jgi:hypothetical protein